MGKTDLGQDIERERVETGAVRLGTESLSNEQYPYFGIEKKCMFQGEHLHSPKLNIPLFSLYPSNRILAALFTLKAWKEIGKHTCLSFYDSMSPPGVTCMVCSLCVV